MRTGEYFPPGYLILLTAILNYQSLPHSSLVFFFFCKLDEERLYKRFFIGNAKCKINWGQQRRVSFYWCADKVYYPNFIVIRIYPHFPVELFYSLPGTLNANFAFALNNAVYAPRKVIDENQLLTFSYSIRILCFIRLTFPHFNSGLISLINFNKLKNIIVI